MTFSSTATVTMGELLAIVGFTDCQFAELQETPVLFQGCSNFQVYLRVHLRLFSTKGAPNSPSPNI